jgi:hypothetical protein
VAKSEQRILQETLVAVTALPDVMAWRNNTGMAWQGQKISRAPGAMVKVERGLVILLEARPISFGLEGSPDIIGVSAGRGFGLEMKAARGRLEDSQPRFRRAWERAGGLYGVPRSVEEALEILRRGG